MASSPSRPGRSTPGRPDPGPRHDFLLILSFGGPEQMGDVMPFLRNAFVTSAYSSYSGCRQYREGRGARADRGRTRCARDPEAKALLRPPRVHRRQRGCGPEGSRGGRSRSPGEDAPRVHRPQHPGGDGAGCDYEAQLRETARLVAAAVKVGEWDLAWQSRSGPATQSWLEPDVRALAVERDRLWEGERAARATAQAAVAQRDEVFAIVAHDLRNPLGRILMSVALLRETMLFVESTLGEGATFNRLPVATRGAGRRSRPRPGSRAQRPGRTG